MKRLLLGIVAVALAVFGLVGCAAASGGDALEIAEGTIEQDGVIVTMQTATAAPKTGDIEGFDYNFDITIENTSDEPVMQVVYGIAILDADGEEIRSFGVVYDNEESAIAPGETVSDHHSSGWGPAVPVTATLTSVTVHPESELPAVHLPKEGDYLYQALGDERLENIKSEPPVSLSFHIDESGYGRTATFKEDDELSRAVELFCDIKVGSDNAESVTDNYNWIRLTWADGSTTSIRLSLRNLEFSGHSNKYHTYGLENLDPFWDFAASHASSDSDEYQQDA